MKRLRWSLSARHCVYISVALSLLALLAAIFGIPESVQDAWNA